MDLFVPIGSALAARCPDSQSVAGIKPASAAIDTDTNGAIPRRSDHRSAFGEQACNA